MDDEQRPAQRAEVIDFGKHLAKHTEFTAEATEAIKSAREWLEQVDRTVGTVAMSLSITFEWRDEFGDRPAGAVVTIDEERLNWVENPRIAAIRDLQRHVREVLALLAPEGGSP